jgi:two-component system OmpR family response regulator
VSTVLSCSLDGRERESTIVSRRVLVVDDEAHIRDVVQFALQREGFTVRSVADGKAARAALAAESFDVIVLDVMLPDVDGLTLCREIRASARTPIVFLSARGEEIDRVLGLELGGDDYLVKPFSPRELVARAKAVLRRASPDAAPDEPRRVLEHGEVRIDLDRHEVRCKGTLVALTQTELGMLAALIERPGIVLSRGQLMQRAYAWDNLVTERTIDTHVRRIRQKLRVHGVDPIATVHGVGYKAADGVA